MVEQSVELINDIVINAQLAFDSLLESKQASCHRSEQQRAKQQYASYQHYHELLKQVGRQFLDLTQQAK